ncbi:MAG: phosphoenolpyruvate--protein phosphotransferase [Treponema sp.]|nr:phosphoenolpyruvate--protein phosphotransferase [Treponema sp.]
MKILQGQGAAGGIAVGPVFFLVKKNREIPQRHIDDVQAELARADAARAKAIAQLETLYQEALKTLGEEDAELFQTHQMMLSDLDYTESLTGIITNEKMNAEYAVMKTSETLAGMFENMDDPYLQARSADVRDVSGRLLDVLQGRDPAEVIIRDSAIIAADDLSPSETLGLDRSKIAGFVTREGSVNSHTAIFARNMGIPAVVALGDGLGPDCGGMMAAIDGASGTLYLEPDDAVMARMRGEYENQKQEKAGLAALKGQPNRSIDGRLMELFANAGSLDDIDSALSNDARGIGLFRSESLYLESKDYPSEDRQFEIYKAAAEKMAGRQVIIRTLDIGADKQAGYFKLPPEQNPALGLRAIRICFDRPEIFITQLRALYRASAFGNIAIMFPMIASVWELRQAIGFASQAKEQLAEEGRAFSPDLKLGIMIETPAAAIISDILAREADFFSIGTNDLTQYTLAADRQNSSIGKYADTHHQAVLRLIRLTAENAHKAGIAVGICGELAGDPSLTETFLRMGIDELSVSPPAILPLRKKIRETDLRLAGPPDDGSSFIVQD